MIRLLLTVPPLFLAMAASLPKVQAAPELHSELIFPLESWHNHGSCIVEAPSGELVVCWFHGSGERKADDVVILGAKKSKGGEGWSEPFLMADTPEFPDTNCCMIIDPQERLWLLWPTIQANLWESALMKYKISEDYQTPGKAPVWAESHVLHVKPGENFPEVVREKTAAYLEATPGLTAGAIEWAQDNFRQADDKLTRRLGWFTRAHPVITESGRMLVGLYSDGFSFSMTAYTDDWGASWQFSEPMVGGGNIQPSYAQKADGTWVAYMRDNGPPPNRVLVSESTDDGASWSMVHDHPELKNPGAGLELMKLRDGRFLVIYNDTEEDRNQLAVSISEDEGATWKWTRHLEKVPPGEGRFHYPSIIEGEDGTLHATYSYFVKNEKGEEVKSIKYARFPLDWVTGGD